MSECLPKRKKICLQDYDYSEPGAYFITICTKNKEKLLWNGEIDVQKFDWKPVGEHSVRPTISAMIRFFKGSITKLVGVNIWQQSFYDHIIRDKNDYEAISKYIHENPLKWEFDELYC